MEAPKQKKFFKFTAEKRQKNLPLQTVKKASQSSPHMRRIESKSFLTAACTWAKIRIRLQVWNLFAAGKQIMRAADCKKLAEKPEGVFDKLKRQKNLPLFVTPTSGSVPEALLQI